MTSPANPTPAPCAAAAPAALPTAAGPAAAIPSAALPLAWTPVLIALFCLVWSLAFPLAKIALRDCPPLLLLAFRFTSAGALMLAACALLGAFRRPSWRDLLALAVMGVLNNACYLGLSYAGMTSVSAGFTAVVISANPLLTALVAARVLGERLTPRRLLGLLMGMAGVAVVLRSRIGSGQEDLVGAFLVLGALATLTAGTVLFKRVRTDAPLFVGSGLQCLAGGLALLPVALATEDVGTVNLTPSLAGAFLFLTLGASVGAFSLWYFILGRTSATKASALHFLMPPLGLLFGWLLLGEEVPLLDLAGIVPIAVGIRMVTAQR